MAFLYGSAIVSVMINEFAYFQFKCTAIYLLYIYRLFVTQSSVYTYLKVLQIAITTILCIQINEKFFQITKWGYRDV